MQRDPWSNEQLRFDRKIENYWPDKKDRADAIVFWGVLAIAVILMLAVSAAVIWE